MAKDARVRYTKLVLRTSLIKLLKEKSLNKITVKELCETAEINRSTFYVYYKDVYDLFEQLEEEFLEKVYDINTPVIIPNSKKHAIKLYQEVCSFFYENRDIYLAISGENGDPGFSRKLIDRMLIWTNDINKQVPMNYSNEMEQRLAVIYLMKGSMEIIYEWIKDDGVLSINEMCNLLYRLNYEGINSKK